MTDINDPKVFEDHDPEKPEISDESNDLHADEEFEEIEGPLPLESGEKLVPGYLVVGHIHRSNRYDVYDVFSEERACRCVAKTPIPMEEETEDPDDEREYFDESAEGLYRESRLLGNMTHPHIVRFYEEIREPVPVLVTEAITGNTLSVLIDDSPKRLPVAALTHLGIHLCSAIHYLHGLGILHLDLKPSNVVSERGMAKILDLSIAHAPGKSKRGAGTLHYLAPEQASGSLVSDKTDVWGIGATLFEAATDELPFHAEEAEKSTSSETSNTSDEEDRVYEQLNRRADYVRKHRRVPAEFAEIIDSCLEPNPEDRPTLGELMQKLEDFAESKGF